MPRLDYSWSSPSGAEHCGIVKRVNQQRQFPVEPSAVPPTKRCRLWLAVRTPSIGVATVTCLFAAHWLILEGHGAPVYLDVAISGCVAGLFALGAMRQPLYLLAIAVLLSIVLPTVHNSSADALFRGCYVAGRALGAYLWCVAGESRVARISLVRGRRISVL